MYQLIVALNLTNSSKIWYYYNVKRYVNKFLKTERSGGIEYEFPETCNWIWRFFHRICLFDGRPSKKRV